MKLSSTISVEFKNTSNVTFASYNTNNQAQMIAPGGCSCTIGCCSCSCGVTNKAQ